MKNLTAKIDGIDVIVADKVSEKLDATIQAKVDAKVGLYKDEVMMKIAMLVEDVKNLKEKAGVNIPIDVANSNDHNSIVPEEDDASSNELVCFLRLIFSVNLLISLTLVFYYTVMDASEEDKFTRWFTNRMCC